MAKIKQKSYQAQARIVTLSSIEITAKDLDEALLKAKELSSDDFVDDKGECIDSEYELTGVYTSE
jgi:hypothetical protein